MKKIFSRSVFSYLIKVVLIMIMILPVCITCLYLYPAADDFSNAYVTRNLLENHKSYFTASISYAYNMYWSTSGYFFAVFFNSFFSPFLRMGVVGIRIFCLLSNLFLYFSLYFFVRVTTKYIAKITNHSIMLNIYILLIFCFTNIYLNVESSFWYCVSVAYVFIITLMLLGISTFILAIFTQKKSPLVFAVILGFLSSSSSLNITALNCFLYLLIGLYGWLVKKSYLRSIIGFGFPLLSGIINLISPGNFLRHDELSSDYNILDAMINSIQLVFSRLYTLFSTSLLPWVLVLLFIYILLYSEGNKIPKVIHPVIMGITYLFALIIFAFPVYLGYGNHFPDRCIFVQDTALYIFLFVLIIYTANWVKWQWKSSKAESKQTYKIAVFLILFIPFCMWHSGKGLTDAYPSIYLARQLIDGNIASFDTYWGSILEEIETSPDENVVIRRPAFYNITLLKDPGLTDDPTYWVNVYVALFYNKESVQLIYE